MSTKTNFKRVALVAVAALGLGVLTSVAPANAGVVAGSSGANLLLCLAGTPTASTTPAYYANGGQVALTYTPNTTGKVTVTGPITISDGGDNGTVASDGLSATMATGASKMKFKFTGTGSASILFDDSTDADVNYYFIVQPSCAPGYSAGTSFAALAAAAATASTNVDEAGTTKIQYNSTSQKVFLNINALTAYGAAASSSTSVNIATVTGGCKISFTDNAVFSAGTTTAISTGSGANTDALVILGDNTPRTCTVTETLDGVVIASKTIAMYGDLATLSIDKDSTKYLAFAEDGTGLYALNSDAITYYAKDSAGNVINHSAAPTMSSQTGSMVGVSSTGGTYGYASSSTNGFATLDVNTTGSLTRGAGTFKIKATRQSDGVTVYSDVFNAENNKSRYTYTAAFDKASYVSGEIMTLTITAKDSAGNTAYDGQTIGVNTIAVSGTTTLTTIATTDTFLNGVKKYKFSAGATASGYGWSVELTSGSYQPAVTGTVNITAPAGGVSNADVLKAIVSLIASINKQIAALQKALLKK
jgi:hypothetical protein